MKYEQEINNILENTFREDWMDDETYNEYVEIIFILLGYSKQDMSNKIDIGVNNGYPVKQQIEILKTVLNKLL